MQVGRVSNGDRNGLFLIGYGATGSTLVTAPLLQAASVMGQATELQTIPTNAFIGPDMAPMGALNQQGTLDRFSRKELQHRKV